MTSLLHTAAVALIEAETRFAFCPDVLARRALRRAEVALARAVAVHANATRPTGEAS